MQAFSLEAPFTVLHFFWYKDQAMVKSFVFGLKVCLIQQRTKQVDILLRPGGECMTWITGTFQVKFTLCSLSLLISLLEAFWVRSLYCVDRCAQWALLLLTFKGEARAVSETRNRNWLGGDLFVFLGFESGAYNLWLQPFWVADKEELCFT